MGLQDIIAIAFAVLAVLYVGWQTIRTLFGKSGGCAGGCDCSTQPSQAESSSPGLKRIPLVPVDQVGITLSDPSSSSDPR